MKTLPPLLMLAEGRKPRPRKAPTSAPSEFQTHVTVAKFLRQFARPGWQWTHIPNGEVRDPRIGAKLKSMGTKPGWPDFVLVPPTGQMHALELKAKGGRLSPEQSAFRDWCESHSVPYCLAFSVDEALSALNAWGALDKRVRVGGWK